MTFILVCNLFQVPWRDPEGEDWSNANAGCPCWAGMKPAPEVCTWEAQAASASPSPSPPSYSARHTGGKSDSTWVEEGIYHQKMCYLNAHTLPGLHTVLVTLAIK